MKDLEQTGAYATDRERVLTETLVMARDQIVELAEHIRYLEDGGPFYVIGEAQPPPDGWQVWNALMLDADERGENPAVVRERIVQHLTFASGEVAR